MYRSIIVPTDGSSLAARAVRCAEFVAASCKAKVTIVQVVPSAGSNATDEAVAVQTDEVVQAQAHVDELRESLPPEVEAESAVTVGEAATEILTEARERQADLIVMSTHGRSGIGRWIYGSVADEVMRHAAVPVLLVPPHAHKVWPRDRAPRILVPLDGSELAFGAIHVADELAEAVRGELLLVRAVEPVPPMYGDPSTFVVTDPTVELEAAKRGLERAAADLRAKGRKVDVADLLGFAVNAITDVARERNIDIIAMSTHGSGGLTRLIMGSVATALIQRADVPVLVARPAEKQS
jgi:nucleotide-binding universal stress UspA family protein